ncbi:nucleotidyl transferase AbiEii/AbiGii toxin family protein [Aureimonas populi]|uniref:Nucleotidyl transferase AbiEii/AbiGii toxin family protein n=1 Tax=Aureimonas populi TaxID=1701758 RepID=A0ABW5CKF3_9HYPH|nr:nucleotidyl transferase AbiEii/AbiGii toxin family protein [Aureimonas populi]
MIPQDYITAWSRVAPWASQRQVEQDLIISRALVAIFSDPFLRGELRFRGGTALNKLHFPAPLRYSEDIDLVRTTAGPIRPLLDQGHLRQGDERTDRPDTRRRMGEGRGNAGAVWGLVIVECLLPFHGPDAAFCQNTLLAQFNHHPA